MTSRVGRPKAIELETLRNRTWARAVLARSGLPPHKMAFLYPQTASGRDSTVFHKTLEIGRPAPHLWLDDGSEGPALRIERAWPGTLQWLLHPLWTTIALCDMPFMHGVYASMVSLSEVAGVQLIRFDENSGDVLRVSAHPVEELEALYADGSLHSLALVVLLAQEASIQCRISDYLRIAEFSATRIAGWSCLRWADDDLKQEIAAAILDGVHRMAPEVVPTPDLASRWCLTQALLMLHQTPKNFGDLVALDHLLRQDVHQKSLS